MNIVNYECNNFDDLTQQMQLRMSPRKSGKDPVPSFDHGVPVSQKIQPKTLPKVRSNVEPLFLGPFHNVFVDFKSLIWFNFIMVV